jgi:23S rRNA (guanosine2251-2'-O)-methyltransferase
MVPWSHEPDPLAALARLRQRGYTLAALEQTDSPTPLASVPAAAFPIALVVGNEVTCVQQRVLDACEMAFELPQYGGKASLNVAVAFGVAAYGLLARMPAG